MKVWAVQKPCIPMHVYSEVSSTELNGTFSKVSVFRIATLICRSQLGSFGTKKVLPPPTPRSYVIPLSLGYQKVSISYSEVNCKFQQNKCRKELARADGATCFAFSVYLKLLFAPWGKKTIWIPELNFPLFISYKMLSVKTEMAKVV